MAATPVRAHLLGVLAVCRDAAAADPLTLPTSATTRSLLAYLLFHRRRSHPRSVLAGLFWPEQSETRARRALTQSLWQIRVVLPHHIDATPEIVGVSPNTPLWIDIEAFQDLIDLSLAAQPQPPSADGLEALRQAMRLYRGDLLEGLYDDWILIERERLREIYLHGLECLIQLERATGHYHTALDFALTLTRADPLRETAHREVMRLYFALQRPTAALDQFEKCSRILREELAAPPEIETVELAREIANRTTETTPPYLPPLKSPAVPLLIDENAAPLPLVGRDAERSALITQIEAALNHLGGVVLIEGEPGIGKTRLLQEIARDAEWRGLQVMQGRAHELEGRVPFGPVMEALAGGLSPLRVEQLSQVVDHVWLQIVSPLLPNLAAYQPDLAVTAPQDARPERDRLINALAHLLIDWAKIAPLLLILEDLHWADEDTLTVLIPLASRLRKQAVLLIGSFRGEEARGQPIVWEKLQALDRAGLRQRLVLSRLGAAATSEIVRRSLGLENTAPLFEERLYRETSGNPLFVLETLRALYDQGWLTRDEQAAWHTPWDGTTTDYAELPLPPVVERTIARRLTYLSPTHRHVLNVAAVLGDEFNFSQWTACSRLETSTVLAAATDLVKRHLLQETSHTYRFGHDKIRQVTYEEIPPDKSRRLHRHVADTLERLDPQSIETLAHHFQRGEVWDKALIYNQRAGDRAASLYAHAEAIGFYDRALEAWGRLASADAAAGMQLRHKRGQACQISGKFDEAETSYRAAYELAQNPIDQAALLNRLSALQYERGNYETAVAFARQALRLSETAGDKPGIASALFNQANAIRNLDRYEQAVGLYKQATAAFEEIDDQVQLADCLCRMGAAFYHIDRLAAAQAFFDRSLGIRQRLDDRVGICYSLINLTTLNLRRGRFARARELSQEALGIATAIEHPFGQTAALHNLGIALSELGCLAEAIDVFQRALELANEIGDQALIPETLCQIALVHQRLGHLEKAREILEQALADISTNAVRLQIPTIHVCLALVLSDLGLNDRALAEAQIALASAVDIQEQYTLGICHEVLGQIAGRLADANRDFDPVYHFEESLRILGEIGSEAELARSRAAYGQFLAASVRTEDARRGRTLLHDAETIFRELGMVYDLAQLDQEAASSPTRLQISVRLPCRDAPLGRAMQENEYVEMTWTVRVPEDAVIADKAARRQHRLLRLLNEAATQGAVPTIDDLARALSVSHATLKRDLAALRRAGHIFSTRGHRE